MFIKPTAEELTSAMEQLSLFGDASVLVANLHKSAIYPIRCANVNVQKLSGIPIRPLSHLLAGSPEVKALGLVARIFVVFCSIDLLMTSNFVAELRVLLHS